MKSTLSEPLVRMKVSSVYTPVPTHRPTTDRDWVRLGQPITLCKDRGTKWSTTEDPPVRIKVETFTLNLHKTARRLPPTKRGDPIRTVPTEKRGPVSTIVYTFSVKEETPYFEGRPSWTLTLPTAHG